MNWRRSVQADIPLLLRLAAAGSSSKAEKPYVSFMRGPRVVEVKQPAEHAEVAGAFNLLLSVASLKNRKLADGLCGGNVLLSTQLGEGGDSRVWPRFFDVYATRTPTGIRDLFVCVGVATPLDLTAGHHPYPRCLSAHECKYVYVRASMCTSTRTPPHPNPNPNPPQAHRGQRQRLLLGSKSLSLRPTDMRLQVDHSSSGTTTRPSAVGRRPPSSPMHSLSPSCSFVASARSRS